MSDIRKQITSFLGRSTTGALGGNPFNTNGEKFKVRAGSDLKSKVINPGVLLDRVLNPRREIPITEVKINPIDQEKFGKKIEPSSFYPSQLSSVDKESNLSEYKDENGRNNLITFYITNTSEILVFRMANFTGFTDSITITQTPKEYFGRPEPFYQYSGVTRNISLNFDVMVYSNDDVDKIYAKLNTLMSLGYPNRYSAQSKMYEPNILKISIGDYLYKQPFFMTTVTFTPSDDVYYYKNKPGLITVSIQGNLVQPQQTPSYETNRYGTYVNNFTNLYVSEETARNQKIEAARSNVGIRTTEPLIFDDELTLRDLSSIGKATVPQVPIIRKAGG